MDGPHSNHPYYAEQFAAEAAFEAQRLRAETEGRVVCRVLTELAGPGCPTLEPLYGRVVFLDEGTVPDAFALVNLGPSGRAIGLAVPNRGEPDRPLMKAARDSDRYRLLIVHRLSTPRHGFEAVLVAVCPSPRRSGGSMEVVTAGEEYADGQQTPASRLHILACSRLWKQVGHEDLIIVSNSPAGSCERRLAAAMGRTPRLSTPKAYGRVHQSRVGTVRRAGAGKPNPV